MGVVWASVGKRGGVKRHPGLFVVAVAVVASACSSGSQPAGTSAQTPPAASTPPASAGTGASPRPVAAAGAANPAGPAAAVLARSHVPVLCYHQIRDWRLADSRPDRSLITPVAVFAQQMDTLARWDYHTVTPDQLYRHLTGGTALPPRPILISFDDGSMGQWPNAVPILRAHRFTATFFIMTVTINKPGGWLSARQIQALDRSGMTIGIHTWDHHAVTGYRPADWRVQLSGAKSTLEGIVGHRIPWFAYPYGSWNAAALPHLADGGVAMAFQLAGPNSPSMPQLTVRRIMPSPYWSLPTFATQITTGF